MNLTEKISEFTDADVHGIRLASPLTPQTDLQARFSWWYNIAAALVQNEVTLDSFNPEALSNQEILATMEKIKISLPDGNNPQPKMKLRLKDGRELEKPLGFKVPDKAEIIDKYHASASLILPKHRVEESLNLVLDLEQLGSLRRLVKVYCAA